MTRLAVRKAVVAVLARTRREDGYPSPDESTSTLTATPFAPDGDGVDTSALTYTARDASSNVLPDLPVTMAVERSFIGTTQSFVDTSATVMDADGVDSVTIYITVMDDALDASGNYIPLPGIPAANVVVTISGSNNTITQPATATDVNGNTTASFTTTTEETKVITVTVLGSALAQQPEVDAGGEIIPPPPGDPFFEDDFAGPGFNNANGFVWGSLDDTAVVSFGGFDALRFRYNVGVNAEQRFDLGRDLTEIWIDYDLYVPANFVKGPGNDKAIRIWGDDYGATNKVGGSTWSNSSYVNDTSVRIDRTATSGIGPQAPSGGGSTSPTAGYAVTLADWTRIRWHFKMCTSTAANDAVAEMWIGTNKVLAWSDQHALYDSSIPYWNAGYFLGAANGGFTEQTDFYIKAPKFYSSDPGW